MLRRGGGDVVTCDTLSLVPHPGETEAILFIYCNKHQILTNIKDWKKTFNLLAINEESL